jgi:hypothetical protein
MNEIAARLAARLFDCRIIENQFRSAFIEAMIEPFLAQTGWRYVGGSWSGWDFERGGIERLEVKQSVQNQEDARPGEGCRIGSHGGSGAFANEWDKL